MREMTEFLRDNGIITRGGRNLTQDQVKHILTNPFYYGDFIYWGELHEGRHEPIISKQLWDKVQEVIKRRGHNLKPVQEPAILCGLLKCACCGCGITATTKTKMQKNGNVHTWIYYHCTRKNRSANCPYRAVRENLLYPQISALISRFSLSTEAISWLRDKIVSVSEAENCENRSVSENLTAQITAMTAKQQILLDSYLDQDIDRPIFIAKKNAIMSEKKTLEENLARLTADQNCWVEPMRKWLDKVETIRKIVENDDFLAIKQLLIEIFGSNLKLKNKNVVASDDQFSISPLENIWHALRAANRKIALSGDNSEKIAIMG
jgi:hypothetical protein